MALKHITKLCGLLALSAWTLELALLSGTTTFVAPVLVDGNTSMISTTEVIAVAGRIAYLPCDTTTLIKDDRLYMILVLRLSDGKPIYSYDVRGRSYNNGLEWSDASAFGPRARFETTLDPTALRIGNIQLDDEGAYRCRVDFKNSPTKNYQINLKVVVPPHKIVMYDEANRDLAGTIGPLVEGDSISVYCEIRGGRPQPDLIWKINNKVVTNSEVIKNDGKVIVSRLHLENVNKTWIDSVVRCQAKNTEILGPLERTARIVMSLKPKSVEIVTKPSVLKAGKEFLLTCVTNGSRPAATTTWWRDNRAYKKGRENVHVNETITVDSMMIVPTPEDDGTNFKCRAENPMIEGAAIEDSFKMNVQYKPVETVTLGSTLNPNDIKEGDDVYFECNIKANPKEHKIVWLHNGKVIKGKHASTKTLVRQRVTREDAGVYACRVTNSEGESTSEGLYLRVQFLPVCVHPGILIIGIQLQDTMKIRCTFIADPPDLTFRWRFNNSDAHFLVSMANFAKGGTSSELNYHAGSERDYGMLVCYAENELGETVHPCIYQIVPASKPLPPRGCTWERVTDKEKGLDYLAIKCQGSYDYFMPQHFTLETIGGKTRVLLNSTKEYPGVFKPLAKDEPYRIITGDIPSLAERELTFWLNITWADLDFKVLSGEKLVVIAHNSVGQSEAFVLNDFVYEADSPAGPSVKIGNSMSLYAICASIIVVSILISIVGAHVIGMCKNRGATSETPKPPAQSVVQVDNQGRHRVTAVSIPVEDKAHPDILDRRAPGVKQDPPRVVLESDDNKMVAVREGLQDVVDDHDTHEEVPQR